LSNAYKAPKYLFHLSILSWVTPGKVAFFGVGHDPALGQENALVNLVRFFVLVRNIF
jgi:hypothetical protein